MVKNKIVFLYIVPIFLSIAFFMLKINGIDFNSWLVFFEILLNALIYPIAFAICITVHFIKGRGRFLFLHSLFMSLIVIFCAFNAYLSWGISTGSYYKPDIETLMIVDFEWQVSLSIIWVHSIILQAIISFKGR